MGEITANTAEHGSFNAVQSQTGSDSPKQIIPQLLEHGQTASHSPPACALYAQTGRGSCYSSVAVHGRTRNRMWPDPF